MNSYTLSRQWFAFAFENRSKVKPIHGSIYFWLIELANKLGWPAEFGNPGSQCMAACGISSYATYKKAFDELADFGFVKVIRKSSNQYSSCIIGLPIFDSSLYKALDKSLSHHYSDHLQSISESTSHITGSINKPLTTEPLNLEPLNSSPPLFENENSDALTAKEKKEKEKNSAQKEKETPVDFGSFDTPEFRKAWGELKAYRKSIKKPIATSDSEQRLINKLSAYSLPFAIKLITDCIDNGWQGVVFKDTPQKYQAYLAEKNNQFRNNEPATYNLRQQPASNESNAVELARALAS